MDWQDIAHAVAPIAPTLGRVLGGALPIPFGGTLGELAGKAIADALGVDATPEKVKEALDATPADVLQAQLAEAEKTAQAQFAAMQEEAKAHGLIGSAQVAAVAGTMQAELVGGTWYQKAWRPLIMYLWAATLPVQAFELLFHLHLASPERLAALDNVILALTTWNGPWAAVAGVYSYNRSQEKVAAIKAAVG